MYVSDIAAGVKGPKTPCASFEVSKTENTKTSRTFLFYESFFLST